MILHKIYFSLYSSALCFSHFTHALEAIDAERYFPFVSRTGYAAMLCIAAAIFLRLYLSSIEGMLEVAIEDDNKASFSLLLSLVR